MTPVKKQKVQLTPIKQEVQSNEVKEEIKETKKDIVLEPLQPGEAYFEDGPSGTVVIGDASRDQIWFRAGNNGKGCWINKKR